MKLLLDENLSRRLVPALQARFPGSSHVTLLGLERATDAQLCAFLQPQELDLFLGAEHGYVLCSKDDDFHRIVPPVVIGRTSIGNSMSARMVTPAPLIAPMTGSRLL